MSVTNILNDIVWIGALDPNLRVFDITTKTNNGTSYNAYLVKGSSKTALIETTHHKFFDEYLDNIRNLDVGNIDYIVLNHTEPDHSGSLSKILGIYPDAQVITSRAGSIYIKNITNLKLDIKVVNDGDIIDLGGKTLQFILAPFLHWPDSMFTYCPEEKVLFPCDFLGAHYCEPRMFSNKVIYKNIYEESFYQYYKSIFAPFKEYVLKGLNKIEGIDINFICPSHGPILTGFDIAVSKDLYKKWSTPIVREKKIISIFYASAYSCTATIANEIKRGVESIASKNGIINIYDVNKYHTSEMADTLNNSDMVIIGSPTINKDAVEPIWNLLSHVDAINAKSIYAAAFGSFGWSGEAVTMITERLKSLKFKVLNDGLKINLVPSENELSSAFEFGVSIANTI